MWYLLLAIAAMSAIMLTLKVMGMKGISIPQAVMVNYLLAAVVSIAAVRGGYNPIETATESWFWIAALAGTMYLASMNLLAYSTKKAGVAVTTVSSRTALVLPVLFSCLFLGERLTGRQTAGIIVTLAALVLILGGGAGKGKGKRNAVVLLPLCVFLMTGTLDIVMKYAQHRVSGSPDYPMFEPSIFLSAFILSIVYYSVTAGRSAFGFTLTGVAGGICLGGFNFLATYGVLHGLHVMPTGIFYPVYYIGVVTVTSLAGIILFGERLSRTKLAGLALAVIAIAVLAG